MRSRRLLRLVSRPLLARSLSAAVIVAVALALWAFWLEPASLRVATYRLSLPRWPAACSGLSIAVISDLHVGSPFNGVEKLERIVAETPAESDWANAWPESAAAMLAMAKKRVRRANARVASASWVTCSALAFTPARFVPLYRFPKQFAPRAAEHVSGRARLGAVEGTARHARGA